eukprot:492267-Amphidinium_carterae.1
MPDVTFTHFQHCMMGGTRDKWSSLLHNVPGISSLGLQCDGRHVHEPFTRARAHAARDVPAAYPLLFCRRVAACFAERCASLGMDVSTLPDRS